MGTNFYARKKLKTKEKQELLKKLNDFLEREIQGWEFLDLFEEKTSKIHLGKRSGGWQFLWQSQPEYYQDNLQSIKEFLTSGEYEIIDEYGEIFSPEEFINTEIGETLYSGLTHDSYMKKNPWERKIPKEHHDWITTDGLRFVNGDFS